MASHGKMFEKLLSQGAYNSGKPAKLVEFFNSGKLWEFLIYSANLCKCDRGHRVLCITVSNSSIDWLAGTVTGMG